MNPLPPKFGPAAGMSVSEDQQLVDEGLVETRRGCGMFINAGARSLLLQCERQKFLSEEWPRIHATIQRPGHPGTGDDRRTLLAAMNYTSLHG